MNRVNLWPFKSKPVRLCGARAAERAIRQQDSGGQLGTGVGAPVEKFRYSRRGGVGNTALQRGASEPLRHWLESVEGMDTDCAGKHG